MSEIELKPCPFCGKPAQLEEDADHHGEFFSLGCSSGYDSGCPGHHVFYTEAAEDRNKCITAWNTRAAHGGTTLYSVIADIREKSGVGVKPMLSELADAIAEKIAASVPAHDRRVLVCGGRDYNDRERVFHELHLLAEKHGWLTIIQGGADGADALAREWAELCHHGLVTFRANWSAEGRGAGLRRNQRMLDGGKPDMVLAFPGGNGTADMVRRAREAGVPVTLVPAHDKRSEDK